MPAASHQLQHAAFIVSTDPSLRGDDDEEDHSVSGTPSTAATKPLVHAVHGDWHMTASYGPGDCYRGQALG